jgi:hypothetical protein
MPLLDESAWPRPCRLACRLSEGLEVGVLITTYGGLAYGRLVLV